MKVPRIRIAWGMALVALFALNFGAIRAWSHLRVGHGIGANGRSITVIDNTYDELFLGSLPMVYLSRPVPAALIAPLLIRQGAHGKAVGS